LGQRVDDYPKTGSWKKTKRGCRRLRAFFGGCSEIPLRWNFQRKIGVFADQRGGSTAFCAG